MKPTIEDFLAYEVKKELADRYFGFRKMIEEDKQGLNRKVRIYSSSLEQKICFDIVRICILLKDENLIHEFFKLTGLDEKLFYDPYLTESPTIRHRVFETVRFRGITRAGRFKNLVLDSYAMLVGHVEECREKLGELEEDHELINEEIKLFYKKNDLSNIMSFLRHLDGAPGNGGMEGGPVVGVSDALAEKLRVQPLDPIEQLLSIIPPLVPLPDIQKEMKQLVEQAYRVHGKTFFDSLAG